MANNLIVHDEYIKEEADNVSKSLKSMNEILSSYIDYLQTLSQEAIQSGDIKNALETFIEYAKQAKDELGELGISINNNMCNYLDYIDLADNYIF